jgi:hypothetical protein
LEENTTSKLAQKLKHNSFITHQSPNSAGGKNKEQYYNINKKTEKTRKSTCHTEINMAIVAQKFCYPLRKGLKVTSDSSDTRQGLLSLTGREGYIKIPLSLKVCDEICLVYRKKNYFVV